MRVYVVVVYNISGGAALQGAPWEGEAPIANDCSTIYFPLVLFAA
jgi:hypothetical protein